MLRSRARPRVPTAVDDGWHRERTFVARTYFSSILLSFTPRRMGEKYVHVGKVRSRSGALRADAPTPRERDRGWLGRVIAPAPPHDRRRPDRYPSRAAADTRPHRQCTHRALSQTAGDEHRLRRTGTTTIPSPNSTDLGERKRRNVRGVERCGSDLDSRRGPAG